MKVAIPVPGKKPVDVEFTFRAATATNSKYTWTPLPAKGHRRPDGHHHGLGPGKRILAREVERMMLFYPPAARHHSALHQRVVGRATGKLKAAAAAIYAKVPTREDGTAGFAPGTSMPMSSRSGI